MLTRPWRSNSQLRVVINHKTNRINQSKQLLRPKPPMLISPSPIRQPKIRKNLQNNQAKLRKSLQNPQLKQLRRLLKLHLRIQKSPKKKRAQSWTLASPSPSWTSLLLETSWVKLKTLQSNTLKKQKPLRVKTELRLLKSLTLLGKTCLELALTSLKKDSAWTSPMRMELVT